MKNYFLECVFFHIICIFNSLLVSETSHICGKSHYAQKLDPVDPKFNKRNLHSANFQISNGLEAFPHSWPWQVSLLRKSGLNWFHCCGGTLISRKLILTAAHCTVYSLDPNDYKVMLGVHDKSKAEAFTFLMDVANVTLADGNSWNKQLWPNDLAIVTMSEDTRFTHEIIPVCLPFDNEFKPGNFCYITGWGKTDNDQKLTTGVLMQAGVFLRGNCASNGTVQFDPQTMVCAGDGNKDTCSGDSGGPLVCQGYDDRWYLFGITSHGFDTTCGRNRPGIYTKVDFYKSLINEALSAAQVN